MKQMRHYKKFGLDLIARHDYDDKEWMAMLDSYIKQSVMFVHEMSNKKGGKVLDVGCSDGRAMKIFKELGYDVVGIDLFPPKDKKGLDIRKMDFYTLSKNFPEGSFDIIFCNHTLEHADSAYKLAYEMTKVLKKGGYIFVAVPDGNTLGGWRLDYSSTHFSIFHEEFLEQIFDRFNFETKEIRGKINLEPKRDNREEIWYLGLKL